MIKFIGYKCLSIKIQFLKMLFFPFQLQQLIQTLQIQQQKPQPSILQALDAGLVVQLQALTAQLTAAAAAANSLTPLDQGVSFNKVLVINT